MLVLVLVLDLLVSCVNKFVTLLHVYIYTYIHTCSVQRILIHFLLSVKQKIKHLQFQIRVPYGIRRSPLPFFFLLSSFLSQSDTSFARYEVRPLSQHFATYPLRYGGNWHLVRFWSFNSIALRNPSKSLEINKHPSNKRKVKLKFVCGKN